MRFKPNKIEKKHVLDAVAKIDSNRDELIPSTRWLVEVNGKTYPPKEIMRAARLQYDNSDDWAYGGGPPTNKYLERMGFKIIDMNNKENTNLLDEFILWYFKNTTRKDGSLTETNIRNDFENSNKLIDKDILNVSESNFSDMLDYLLIELYKKGTPFHKYSSETASHRPRAILGKENYLKFLEERFNYLSELLFLKTAKKYKKDELIKFFDFLEELMKETGIAKNDDRVAFSCAQDSLSLTVGQRPSWRLTNLRGFRYVANADVKLSEYATNFDGKLGNFYNQFYEIELNSYEKEAIIRTTKIELSRTNKTGFSKYHNPYFEKAAFDRNYRNQVLKLGLMNESTIQNQKFDLNNILYGPPGTGKTFKLQKEYFDLFTVKETSLNRSQYLENIVADLTWWQVLSIILLDLKKVKVNEIINHELLEIKGKLSNSKTMRPTVWGRLQAHTKIDCLNVNVTDRSQPPIFYKDEESKWNVDEDLLEQYYPEAFIVLDEVKNFIPSADKLIRNYEFVTFHQSFSYEDFIEGIKPKLGEDENDIAYEIQDGIFKKLCLKADVDRDNNYAIFIDEINRGNVSAIFGELITLIEKDKRLDQENELKVKLPYSKKELGVPPNLYIFGTMNTADRSVEALDTALRRRFSFEEIMPIPELLANIEFDYFNLSEVLTIINNRIEALLDRDHTIGHSYFMSINSGDSEGLKNVFQNNVIPLLQEYFYHDYEKIALILGEGFIEHKESKVKFANFKNIEPPEIDSSFELKTIEDIESAIVILLNKKDEERE